MKRILLVSSDHSVSATRTLLLERAGYSVTRVDSVQEGTRLLSDQDFNLVLGGILLPAKEQATLALATKKIRPNLPFIAFHNGPPLPNEDAALAPLDGPEAFLRKVGELIMQEHGHPEIQSEYFAFVDKLRVYVHVSDGVCKMLAYHRDEIIGKRIDDLAVRGSADVGRLFHRYLEDGSQEGTFRLLHRDGHPVTINYKARVLDDGCLVSEWEPERFVKNAQAQSGTIPTSRQNPA